MEDFKRRVALIEAAPETRDKASALTRFRGVWARFAESLPHLPPDGHGVTLIAGTNGKGSVAKTLETLWRAHGTSVGLFTSPHLSSICERIRTHGGDLSEAEFSRAHACVESFAGKTTLSRFEILTLMMAEVFFGGRVRPPVERAVIEVGVGGTRDPTRVIPHDTCVITRLGLDHQEMLGPDLASIAREKLGIVEPGNLVVHVPFDAEACVIQSPEWIELTASPFSVSRRNSEPVWILHSEWGEAALGILGARAVENVSLALRTFHAQSGARPPIESLATLRWPGRMELREVDGRRIYFSGDHNPQGVASLGEILEHFEYTVLHLVVGVGERKALDEMLEEFLRLPRARLYLTETPFKSLRLADYGGHWRAQAIRCEERPEILLRSVLDASAANDLILVTGSLYLVGYLRDALGDK